MTLWALGVYFGLVLFLVTAMLVVSYLLGQRHHENATGVPYESGIVSAGSAHVRLSAKFYLVAMFSSSSIWKRHSSLPGQWQDASWAGPDIGKS